MNELTDHEQWPVVAFMDEMIIKHISDNEKLSEIVTKFMPFAIMIDAHNDLASISNTDMLKHSLLCMNAMRSFIFKFNRKYNQQTSHTIECTKSLIDDAIYQEKKDKKNDILKERACDSEGSHKKGYLKTIFGRIKDKCNRSKHCNGKNYKLNLLDSSFVETRLLSTEFVKTDFNKNDIIEFMISVFAHQCNKEIPLNHFIFTGITDKYVRKILTELIEIVSMINEVIIILQSKSLSEYFGKDTKEFCRELLSCFEGNNHIKTKDMINFIDKRKKIAHKLVVCLEYAANR